MRVTLSSAVLLLLALPSAVQAVVISELHYNPRVGEENLELIELANDSSTPEDLSGYSFTNGVDFTFPAGTILPGNGFLVVAQDAEAVRTKYGITNVLGNFTGRLDASGERLTLVNQVGVVLQNVRYRDRGKWPAEPDGTGHTLSLRSVHLDSSEPESWAPSDELGGTPGLPNFAGSEPRFEERVLVARGETWRYAKGTQAFSNPTTAWRNPGFDDAAWSAGPSGFGYGDGDDATDLPDMMNTYLTVAIRKKVTLSAAELAAAGDFYLLMDYDDGFCAFLNGAELARVNCGTTGVELPWDAVATGSREAGSEEAFVIPRDQLIAGENTLAIVGHNFSAGSSDFSLIPRIVHRKLLTSQGSGRLPVTFNELYRGPSAGQGWVELWNSSDQPLDLSGYQLTDSPARPDPLILPANTVLAPRGFLVVDEAASGLTFSAPEVHLYLLSPTGLAGTAAVFDRAPPAGLSQGQFSEVRFPDGGPLEWVTPTPTRGASNTVSRVTDVVINEILYHPPERVDVDLSPADRLKGEFIELYNRGASPVDLSGFKLDKGVDYAFPQGTVLAAGGYLVIADDPALLLARYGYPGALGPYDGKLSNSGENLRLVDTSENVVDEVRYAEGGSWSVWADGGGSSLELIDPAQDNTSASAWDASDETPKTQWEQVGFQVPSYVAAAESELHLYLVGRGEVLVDDVSITPAAGGANAIPNPGFETNTSGWTIEGTHSKSRRVTSDKHSGNASLLLSASSKGDTLVNRLEIETSPPLAQGGRYNVSLWARWQRGASVVIAHGEFTAGAYGGRPGPAVNLSGNSLSGAIRLTVPLDIGTPGAENSARKKLREATGSGNLGPVISEVAQSPVSPSPAQTVRVVARISDSEGVASATLNYRTDNANGAFTQVPLVDDGGHGDGEAGDGIFGAELPALGNGTLVVYYVEARDALNATRRYPVEAPARTLLYQVQGPVGPGVDSGRIILDSARRTELETRTLHSQELVDGSFVFNDTTIYQNVGIRYRGSPWGRPGRSNYRVKFPDDKPFVRNRKAMNLDNSGGGPVEGACYFLIGRNGTPAVPAATCEYAYMRTYYNGGGIGMRGLLQPVDRQFMEDWYGETDGSVVYKVEGRRAFNDGDGLAGWDGASFIHRGNNPENYRDYFYQGVRRSVDPWQEWMDLTRVMDTKTTSNAQFDLEIDNHLHVEAFLRVLAPRILQADWDAFCVGNGHNGYMVYPPADGLWRYLGFDMDNAFGGAPSLFPTADPFVARLMNRPGPRRTYFRILWEYTAGYWSSAGAGPYFDAVSRDTGIGMSGLKATLDSTGASVRSQVQSSTTVAFRIVTNAGADITTAAASIKLQGDAAVQIASILYTRNGGDPVELSPAWTTPTRWEATFDLPEAENNFDFLGFDAGGDLAGSTSIKITTSAVPSGPTVSIVFPTVGPAAGGTLVTFTGTGFVEGTRVVFGGVDSTAVTLLGPDVIQAITPPAAFPFPADLKVDIEIITPSSGRTKLVKAFSLNTEGGFVRGDVTFDLAVDLSDAVAMLFHLFRSSPLLCPDAADVNDDGAVNITDVISTLSYLFQAGAPPRAPFPGRGVDQTADPLACP